MKVTVLLLNFISLVLISLPAKALEIPSFTSNVMDPQDYLSGAEKEQIQQRFTKLRDESGIYPAVYVIGSLESDSIEAVAERAFQKWGLGAKGIDNGLLLVLAMQDRKSRFEVGYGLEGSITDLHSRVALDDFLAPEMRRNNLKDAILNSFNYLEQVHHKDPTALAHLQSSLQKQQGSQFAFNYLGVLVYFVFLFVIWLGPIISRGYDARLARKIESKSADYRQELDPRFYPEISARNVLFNRLQSAKKSSRFPVSLFIRAFLSLNPGIFLLLAPSFYSPSGVILMALLAIGMVWYMWQNSRRYKPGTKVFRKYQDYLLQNQKAKEAILKTPLEDIMKQQVPFSFVTPFGVVTGSAAASSLNRARSASSSNSNTSSTSSSSSSGGGRSGGGGASSSW